MLVDVVLVGGGFGLVCCGFLLRFVSGGLGL